MALSIRTRNTPVSFALREQAFSLLEMVAVMALISFLFTLLYLNAPPITGAMGVTSGGQLVYDSLNYARENATIKGVPNVVVIRRTGVHRWQRLAVFSMPPDGDAWTQLTKWENLPQRAYIDPHYDPSTEPWNKKPLGIAQGQDQIPAPTVAIKDGSDILDGDTDYYCISFVPSGGILADNNIALRVIRGRDLNGQIVADSGSDGEPLDWVKLIVEKVAGQVKRLSVGQQ